MGSVVAIGTAVIDTVLSTHVKLNNELCNKVIRSSADGGAIRNVAHNLALLGDEVLFWAKFGNDLEALDMITRLELLKIQVYAKFINLPTPHFYQLYEQDTSMMISSTADDFYFNQRDLLPNFLLHDEKFGITDQDDDAFLKKLHDRSPDLRWIALGFLPPHDLINMFIAVFVNKKEALRYAESTDDFFQKASDFPLTVVTMDQEGLRYACEDGEIKSLEAPVLGKGNVLGMGDALVAGFLHRYLEGLPIEASLTFAIECARRTSEVTTSVNQEILKM